MILFSRRGSFLPSIYEMRKSCICTTLEYTDKQFWAEYLSATPFFSSSDFVLPLACDYLDVLCSQKPTSMNPFRYQYNP